MNFVFYGRKPSNSNKYLVSCVLTYIFFKSSEEIEGSWVQPYFLTISYVQGLPEGLEETTNNLGAFCA